MMRWVWGYGKRKVRLEGRYKNIRDYEYAVCDYNGTQGWSVYIFPTQLYLLLSDYTDPKVAPLEYAEALVRLSIPEAK